MPPLKPITIAGGGVAGLALGISLRRNGVPATVFEAGAYPRHRVCGEFISGRGQEVLRRLELWEQLLERGCLAFTAAFFHGRHSLARRRLPKPALCVSRFELDAFLADEFRRRGGDLQERRRCDVAELREGAIRATGRRAQTSANSWRWFGLKAHARGVNLGSDLEMHFHSGGYVGICRLAGDLVNVCGLFRSPTAVPGLTEQWRQWLSGPDESILHERLSRAEFLPETFCSVAGLSFESPEWPRADGAIGDAISMIAPVTGNGMSMAFESAELAAGPLRAYSRGDMNWKQTQELIAADCKGRFARRLAWAFTMQRLLFAGSLGSILTRVALPVPGIWPLLFSRTR